MEEIFPREKWRFDVYNLPLKEGLEKEIEDMYIIDAFECAKELAKATQGGKEFRNEKTDFLWRLLWRVMKRGYKFDNMEMKYDKEAENVYHAIAYEIRRLRSEAEKDKPLKLTQPEYDTGDFVAVRRKYKERKLKRIMEYINNKKEKKMKILVINSTGNVGKSFLAREVLYPLLSEEKVLYEIEKFNKGSKKFIGKDINYKLVEPDKLENIVPELLVTENAVIDVGASSVDDFLRLGKEHGIFDFADMVVVPTVLEAKQIADTGEIIKKLQEVTASDKIFIVFNRVSDELDNDEAIEDNEHYGMLKSSLAGSDIECDPEYRLKNYDVVDKMSKMELNIADVLADKTDYMKEIAKIKNDENMPKEEKLKLVKDLYDKHLVQKRAKEMQKDFERLATRLAVFIK